MRHVFFALFLSVAVLPSECLADIQFANFLEAGRSNATAVQGNHVFGGLGRHLLSIDVTDPTDPVRVASTFLAGNVYDIVVSGNVAYVGTGSNLSIFDISNPSAPLLLGVESGSGALGVALSGSIAYVTLGTQGLRSIDVTNPANPVALGAAAAVGWPQGIRVSGSYAYLGGIVGDLTVVDISNPSAPTQVGFLAIWGTGLDVEVVDDLVYVPGRDGLAIVDVGVPASPIEVGRYAHFSLQGVCVSVVDGYAYVLGSYGDLVVVDVSDPTQPVPVADDLYLGGVDVARSGDQLYVADPESSFRLVDISDPFEPSAIGTHHALRLTHNVALQEGLMYVGEDWRLTTMDVDDAFAPDWITSIYSYGPNTVLAPTGATLFVGRHASIFDGGDGGLSIFDVTTPASPVEVSWNWGFDGVYDLYVDGSYVYLLGAPRSGQTTFVTYDVTNLSAPIQVSSINVPFLSPNFDISGDVAIVACMSNDVKFYNIANPAAPVLISTFTATQDARDVVAMGHVAFVADVSAGLIVVDFLNPASPVEIGRLSGLGQPAYIADAYPHVVLAGSDPLMRIVNVSDPTAPLVVDSYQTGGSREIAIDGSTIATVLVAKGVLLLDAPILDPATNVEVPLRQVAMSAYPNPFNPRTTISFSLPSATHVEIEVFDVSGTHVRTLAAKFFGVGDHRVDWDGRDKAGSTCASGVYFARMQASGKTLNRKLVLLK